MNKTVLFIYFSLILAINTQAKVVIFTYAFNRPEFIEFQHKTFQKFLKDEYEFIIFSDAKSDKEHKEIESVCRKYNLKCIAIPQEIHDRPYLERTPSTHFSNYHAASVRNCNVVQYSLDTLGFNHDDILLLIDSDMFLIKELNIRSYLEGHELAAAKKMCNAYPKHDCNILHPHIEPFSYLWIGLVFLNMATLPNKKTINFNCGNVFKTIPVDSGGYTAYYLKNNPKVQLKEISWRSLESMICQNCELRKKPAPPCTHNTTLLTNFGLDNEAINLAQKLNLVGDDFSKHGRPIEFLMDGYFLHYRAGTNYQGFSSNYHQKKTNLLTAFLHNLLK